LEAFAGVAGQFGIFAATYGIAVVHLVESPVQVVVIGKDQEDIAAQELYRAAVEHFAFAKSVLRLSNNEAVAANLPPALAATIPNLPEHPGRESFAVVCSGTVCQPPVRSVEELRRTLEAASPLDCSGLARI
jgi:uncharacterized protein YyaL (SSP411 family)